MEAEWLGTASVNQLFLLRRSPAAATLVSLVLARLQELFPGPEGAEAATSTENCSLLVLADIVGETPSDVLQSHGEYRRKQPDRAPKLSSQWPYEYLQ